MRGDVDVVVKSSDSSPIGELELGEVAGDLLLNLGWKKHIFGQLKTHISTTKIESIFRIK